MKQRVVTKVGDIFQTKHGHLLQLVAIDPVQLNSDVVIVYKGNEDEDISNIHLKPVLFYHHTTMSAGVKKGLWKKVGKGTTPDISNLIFKQRIDKELVAILSKSPINKLFSHLSPKPRAYWKVWNATDDTWREVSDEKGQKVIAEQGGITPPDDIIYRIKHGKSQFVFK